MIHIVGVLHTCVVIQNQRPGYGIATLNYKHKQYLIDILIVIHQRVKREQPSFHGKINNNKIIIIYYHSQTAVRTSVSVLIHQHYKIEDLCQCISLL
jgi:hypothetical protein